MVASITPRQLSNLINQASAPLVLDVRRSEAFNASPHMLPASQWRDPDSAGMWSGDLPRDRQIVVYCVHGHVVSQGVAVALALSRIPI